MMQKQINQEQEIEIDLSRLLRAVISKAWLIVLVSILTAGLALSYTRFMVTPQYKSTAMFYVNNNSLKVGSTSVSISSGDLVTSRGLVDSYIVILGTRETFEEVIEAAGSTRSYSELLSMTSAGAVNETEIFSVTVTSPDPQEAELLANAIAEVLPNRIGNIIEGSAAKVVDYAVVPASPSSPNISRNTIIGFALGFLMSVGLIAVREIFDTVIRSSDELSDISNHPILASVPDMTQGSKGGYEYTYNRDGEKHQKKAGSRKPVLFGQNVSFTTAEAYKLLRTKLQFSFADDKKCHVIGISSSLSGEGKSLTSINLAYTLSQLGNRVILVDCDMRRPTLAEKLNINKKPGLSSCLTGQDKLHKLIQNCGIPKEEEAFHVITAGQNPPNPVELLSSANMETMLATLREEYDYVILDLPPVGEVSDAMAVAKQTDGILLVVRQDACDRNALSDTIRQFEFVEARILGLVFNCVSDTGKGYYKKYRGYRYGYYRRGYGYYRRGYGYYQRRQKNDTEKSE